VTPAPLTGRTVNDPVDKVIEHVLDREVGEQRAGEVPQNRRQRGLDDHGPSHRNSDEPAGVWTGHATT
jgi:hypothetical protein